MEAQSRTWQHMPTGNGHGFQVFDRDRHRITTFLEHPYSFVAPGAADRTWGVQRRDLAHDIYFGVRAGGTTTWLHDQMSVEYEAQSHIIHGSSTQSGVLTDTYYFGPFGYEGNGMVMLIRARNEGSAAASVSLYAKPNLLLGGQAGGVRAERGSDGEQIRWNPSATPPHATETGPGGGRAIYVPIGEVTAVSCGGDMAMYEAVRTSGNVGSTAMCTGNNQVPVFQRDVMLDAGAEAWWGVAVLFLNDDPAEPQAADFRDLRTIDEILALWNEFAAGRDAQAIHDDALAEIEDEYRVPEAMPPGLSDRERGLWRQSEVILRLGQVREANQPNRENHGMMLASLPPGSWHIGWVRDGAYGIASLAMTGHYTEARMGLDFLLGADGATHGFFSDAAHLGAPYRVSATRYFGNGKEEGDYNSDGPNVETDGWGLVLWAAGLYLYYSCDEGWLDSTTWRGDTVWEALLEVAADIEEQIVSDLPGADTSIWEVHWNRRQVFTYTAATQIRGLYDFAAVAERRGETETAEHYRGVADRMLERTKTGLVYSGTRSLVSHQGVAASPVHVDGSTVEMLAWGLIETSDPIYMGTLNGYSKLITGFGGYQRLEPMLSLTGEGSAGTYDTSEWVLLDLRIGEAWRRAGRTDLADSLLDKVTDNSAVNDNLVSELYDRSSGAYTGAIPMVGYGAGAWMMTQLDKHGAPAPPAGPDFTGCDTPRPDGGIFVPGDGGFRPPTDGGAAGDAGPVTFTDDAACLCTAPGARTGNAPLGALAAAALLLLVFVRRARTGAAPLLAALAFTALAFPARAQEAAEPDADEASSEPSPEEAEPQPGAETTLPETRPEDASGPWWTRGEGVEPADAQAATAPARPGAAPAAETQPAQTAVPHPADVDADVASGTRPNAPDEWPARLTVERPVFGEDEHADDVSPDWRLTFHGYARMPLAWYGAAQRPAYLVDSDYFLSGFNYTRVAEREWAELFVGAQKNRTRFVVGLFASQLSDWSETSLQGQGGIATAFVEHTEPLTPDLDVGVRAGMFWDRYGYLPRYDTYLFGRLHVAGVRLSGRLFDRFYLRTGFGAHADVVSSNQGFTPAVWASLGVDLGWLDVGLHAFEVWTSDSEREFAIIENGSLTVLGADAHVALDSIGRLYLGLAHYDADQVVFLANTLELLHSTGGRGLTENFFGLDSQNGTGSVIAGAFELAWEPGRTLAAVSGADAARALRGLELRLFALTAHVKSEQASPDPLANRDDRTYFKWGGELFWRPRFGDFDAVYGALRYDRVVLDTDHDSMTYRVLSPRIGVTPMTGLDLFVQYSRYAYGDNVSLRPNQIPGDISVTQPDGHAFKIQAEVAW